MTELSSEGNQKWLAWCKPCHEGYRGTQADAETWEMYHEAERHEA